MKLYNAANKADKATAAALSPSGKKIFVTGSSKVPMTGTDYNTVAYKVSNGSILWAKRFDAAAFKDEPSAIDVSPNGKRVFVTGTADLGAPNKLDYATVAYKASNGKKLWVSYYENSFHDLGDGDWARSIKATNKRVFVTGVSAGNGSGSSFFGTVAYKASNGNEVWRRYKDTAGYAYALDLSPDGKRVFVTGEYRKQSGAQDFGTVAYKAGSGATIWKKSYDGPGHDFDYATAIVAHGKGVYVTGYSVGGASTGSTADYATVAYKRTNGQVLWKDRYDGPGQGADIPAAIAAGGNKVVVTGSSTGNGTGASDYATIAYKALGSGTPLWVRREDGPASGKDLAASVTVNAQGNRVFVTGKWKGTGTGFDYGTVAYAMPPSSTSALWTASYTPVGTDAATAVVTNGNRVLVTGASHGSGAADFDFGTLSYDL